MSRPYNYDLLLHSVFPERRREALFLDDVTSLINTIVMPNGFIDKRHWVLVLVDEYRELVGVKDALARLIDVRIQDFRFFVANIEEHGGCTIQEFGNQILAVHHELASSIAGRLFQRLRSKHQFVLIQVRGRDVPCVRRAVARHEHHAQWIRAVVWHRRHGGPPLLYSPAHHVPLLVYRPPDALPGSDDAAPS
jgi:hypothetical protein